jgi:hypothetical protein
VKSFVTDWVKLASREVHGLDFGLDFHLLKFRLGGGSVAVMPPTLATSAGQPRDTYFLADFDGVQTGPEWGAASVAPHFLSNPRTGCRARV